MIIAAKFAGRCQCGAPISAGQQVEWERGSKARCLSCTAPETTETITVTKVPRQWSPLQRAVFDAVLDPNVGNLMVRAVAGSGKTTTMIEAATRVRNAHPNASIVMVAFNKDIATELKGRVPAGVGAATFHGLCFRELMRHLKAQPRVDAQKIRRIGRDMTRAGVIDREIADLYLAGAVTLCEKAKGAGIGVCMEDTFENWYRLLLRFEIEFEGSNDTTGIKLAQRLLQASNEDLSVIDFDDQLYLTALLNLKLTRLDYLFIDEAQDFNGIQRLLVHRLLADNGKLIAVGDNFQSIYGFRGADSDSMDLISSEFGCAELPLSISYRCPQNVVRAAQAIVPHIEYSDTAAAGIVASLPEYRLSDFQPSDMVLCRNTAPLVTLAYKCLGAKVNCRVLGREIGQGLVNLIRRMKADDIEDLQEQLADYRRTEVARLNAHMEEEKAAALEDKIDSICIAIGNMTGERTVENLINEIDSLFGTGVEGVLTLSTIHRAKGKEAQRVFILNPELMPSKHAKTDDQRAQERNVMYVAYTRAMSELYFVNVAAMW